MHEPSEPRATTPALLLTALLALPFAAGCAVHAHPAPPHGHAHGHAAAVRVVVARGHVHGPRCGHYRYRGHWYHLRGHAHGPRCGHSWVGGVWVLRR